MTYFLPTKRYILIWKSNYNLKEHKSCGKKSKMIRRNMKKQLNWNEKVKSGKVNRFPIGQVSSLEDLDVFSSNTQTETSWCSLQIRDLVVLKSSPSGWFFTAIHESQDKKGGGHCFNSSLPLSSASQKLRH